jgi:hypothetical protein
MVYCNQKERVRKTSDTWTDFSGPWCPCASPLTLPHRYRPSDLSITRIAKWWFENAPTHIHSKPHTKPSEEALSSQWKLFTFPESTSAFQNVHKNTTSGVAWSQSLSLSFSRATLQWKLDRSPSAAESSGVQPRVSHHKALPCYVHQLPVLSPSYCSRSTDLFSQNYLAIQKLTFWPPFLN